MGRVTYEPRAFAGLDRAEVLARVRAEGWEPAAFTDPPGALYPWHRHPEAKLLAFLTGSMEVRVEGQTYRCQAGDKLIIPGNAEHAAVVGPEGCTFFWSEQLGSER